MNIEIWLFGLFWVIVAGFARGLAGFGGALILVPTLSLIFPTQQVVATVILLEILAGASLVPEAVTKAQWRKLLPLVVSAALMVPCGAYLLTLLKPDLINQIIGGLILGFTLLLLLLGKRRFGQPSITVTFGVGAMSGILTGLGGIGGPPIVLYAMSGNNSAANNRANFIIFFALTQSIALLVYGLSGILTLEVWRLFALFVPALIIGLFLGRLCFKKIDEKLFRKFVLLLLLVVSAMSLVNS
jgi:uncharacterized membrane protein YfcA